MIDIFLLSFATLFVVIDPIGIAPIATSLTEGNEKSVRRRIVLRAAMIAFFILMVFGLIGESFLEAIGIGMPAFRIAGGLLLLLTAIEMLFEKRNPRRQAMEPQSDPTVFPLALPLMAGPGAMTSMILLNSEYQGQLDAQLVIFATMILVLALTVTFSLLFIKAADRLGDGVIQLLNRLLGVLLAALSVQFIADGVTAYIQGIA